MKNEKIIKYRKRKKVNRIICLVGAVLVFFLIIVAIVKSDTMTKNAMTSIVGNGEKGMQITTVHTENNTKDESSTEENNEVIENDIYPESFALEFINGKLVGGETIEGRKLNIGEMDEEGKVHKINENK